MGKETHSIHLLDIKDARILEHNVEYNISITLLTRKLHSVPLILCWKAADQINSGL